MALGNKKFSFRVVYRNRHHYDSITVPSIDSALDKLGSTTESQPGGEARHFATRIYDVRWAGRRNNRYINRAGIPALLYKSFYAHPELRDTLTGTLRVSGIIAAQRFSIGATQSETNLEIGYLSPVLIKVLQPNYQSSATKDERGQIYEEQAELTVAPVAMFTKWDIIKTLDKFWVVQEEPKVVFDKRGHTEGFILKVSSLRPGIIDW